MGTDAPTSVTIPVHCAPKKAPCPKCGKHGGRKRKLPLGKVRTVAYKAIADLEITCGEYQAQCDCCTTLCNTPEAVLSSPPTTEDARPYSETTSSCRLRIWWCSATTVGIRTLDLALKDPAIMNRNRSMWVEIILGFCHNRTIPVYSMRE
jgi:hypothetical protein